MNYTYCYRWNGIVAIIGDVMIIQYKPNQFCLGFIQRINITITKTLVCLSNHYI
jgi:hypothetical protein